MAGAEEYVPNYARFLKMYNDLAGGQICRPRGQAIIELEDYALVLNAGESCITSFEARKMNLKYAVNEFLWYLRGDPYDTSIEEFASMWPKIKQPGGFYFSNYGQYMFGAGAGVEWAIEELIRDKDSRRAAFPFLHRDHCFADNRDMVCTYSMSFRIRFDRLNMSINMRSNDAIFGTTNDVFCFWMTYLMVLAVLREKYPNLQPGRYVHKVDSLHVYERHWDMLQQLNYNGKMGYYHISVPDPTSYEARRILDGGALMSTSGDWSKWLIETSRTS